MKPRIPEVPLEVLFAAKILFYMVLLACCLYIVKGPAPSEPIGFY
jgi:hypothetical protein